jgi:hypothetical protein
MSSTLNPTQIDPRDIPTLAPDVVVTRADIDLSKTVPDGKTGASAAQKGAASAASATVPPVDTAFRAASTNNVRGRARPSFGRRVMRGVMGMVLTACLAGAAVLWQSRGGAVRPIVAERVPPFVLTSLSPPQSPAVDQQSAAPALDASAVTAAPPPSAPQSAVDNFASNAASPLPESAQLLQSMVRDLADLRQDMEQMKARIAELKASQDQMASEVAKASEQNLRPKVSLVSPPPAQPIAAPARKPLPIVRPMQPGAASASPQAAASYVPRRAEPRAVAPLPRSAAAPPADLSVPRPPAPLREQMP